MLPSPDRRRAWMGAWRCERRGYTGRCPAPIGIGAPLASECLLAKPKCCAWALPAAGRSVALRVAQQKPSVALGSSPQRSAFWQRPSVALGPSPPQKPIVALGSSPQRSALWQQPSVALGSSPQRSALWEKPSVALGSSPQRGALWRRVCTAEAQCCARVIPAAERSLAASSPVLRYGPPFSGAHSGRSPV